MNGERKKKRENLNSDKSMGYEIEISEHSEIYRDPWERLEIKTKEKTK